MSDTTDWRWEHFIRRKPTAEERISATYEAASFLAHMTRRKRGTPVNQKWQRDNHVAVIQAKGKWE